MEPTIAMEKKLIFNNRLSRIDNLLHSLPNTQKDAIAELRNNILSGKYEMNPEKIVEKILWHGVHVLHISERKSPDSS